jgi:WD40 repeat protein
LVPGVPPDIETIALKCLQKEPAKRYDSAAALADDLRRFHAGEPIMARPVPPWERAIKWARRRPAIAALVAALLLLVASLLGGGIWSYSKINRSLALAKDQRTKAESLAQAEAKASALAREQTAKAQEQTKVANQRAEDLAWEDYINRVNRAYREVQDNNVALAEDLLLGCPNDRRGWEWHYVNRLCHPERLSLEAPAGSVYAIAYSPDGRQLATASGGPFSVGKGGSNVELWDRETGQRQPTLPGTEHHIWSLAFSPDGTKLAVGGRSAPIGRPQVMVRDAKTGEVLWTKHEPALPQAMGVAFSPDGKSLAVGLGEYSGPGAHPVKLYDVATGQGTTTFPGLEGGVNDLAFHPDGRHLAVAGSDLVEVWDIAAHTKVHALRGHSKWVYAVAFSPDGKWLATGGWDRTIKLRDAATGEERLTLFGHEGFVLDLAFSPDSRSLASASEDRTVRLWEIPTGRQIWVLHGHTDFVQAVAFAPDGHELASGGMEGTTKVWDLRTSLPLVVPAGASIWFRRDGRRFIITYKAQIRGQGITKGWDPATGEQDPTLTGLDRTQLGDEYLEYPIPPTPGVPPPSATSPDGRLQARVVRSGRGLFDFGLRSKSYTTSSVQVGDLKTGRVLYTLIGHTADVVFIAFSPDGRRIATASYDRTAKLWDTATGREVFTLRGHAGAVVGLAFSPDGHRIVSSGWDDTAHLWDASPFPVDVLQSQEARYRQKQTELTALRDLSEAEGFVNGGNDQSRTGQWELAAAAFGKLVEGDPNSLRVRYQHILLLEESRNRSGVQRACQDLLERFGNATDPAQANGVAWSCVLVPDAVTDREAPIRLAEAALAKWSEAGAGDVLNTLGAALYRAGRFEEAIRRLEESIKTRGDEGVPKGFAFLAMAHHRLGHLGDAKHWLDKLIAWQVDEATSSWDELQIRILRREAETLILGSRSAAATSDSVAPPENESGDLEAKPE